MGACPGEQRYSLGMSRVTSNQYELRRASDKCAATGQDLSPGDSIIAALTERVGEEGFDRVDVLTEAWEQGYRPERLFAQWRTRVPASDAKPNPFIDDEALLDLFDSLADAEHSDTRRLAFRHLLALILVRKRLLVQVGMSPATSKARSALLVRRRGVSSEMPPQRVETPEITPELVDALTRQLTDILSQEV